MKEKETGSVRFRWDRRDGLVLAAALALRLLHLAFFAGNPMFDHPVLDPKYYDDWGLRIAAGDWLGGEVFEMSPLYPYFLGLVFSVFGHSYLAVFVIQAVLGAVTCWFILRIADRIFGRLAGTWAGCIAAAYPVFIYYDILVMKTAMGVFFATGSVYFLVRDRGRFDPLFAGLFLGAAVLVRDNYLAALPLLAAWLAVRAAWGGRGRVVAAGGLVLGTFLAILPVTIRNYVVSGEIVLTTSGGGEVFYVGNNPSANGLYQYPIFIRPDPQFEHEDFRARAREETGRDLTRGEASRFWWRKGFEFLADDPIGAAGLYLRKLALMWNRHEVADNYSFDFFRSDVSPVLKIPLSFSILAALGLLGVGVSRRRWRACMPLYLFETAYMAGLVLFFIHSRYRLPLVPVLIVFSSSAILWLFESWRAAAWGRLGIAVASGAAVYLLTMLPLVPESYSNRWNFYEKLGVAYLEDGDMTRARVALERSRRINDRNPNIHYNLGLVAQAEGDYRQAYAHYQRAVELSPLFRGAHEKIETLSKLTDVGLFDTIDRMRKDLEVRGIPPAVVHLEIGKKLLEERVLTSAIAELEEAVRLDPSSSEAQLRLAEAYSRNGEHTKAIETMKLRVAADPGDASAQAALARCYIMATRFAEARDVLLRARSVDPARLELYFHLGQAEAGLGRPEEARKAYREYLDRGATGPGAEMARQALRELGR